jgi:hypothetical protein
MKTDPRVAERLRKHPIWSTSGNGKPCPDLPIRMLQIPAAQARFFEPQQARDVLNVLGMLIHTVGKDSLLGTILSQTRTEVASIMNANS